MAASEAIDSEPAARAGAPLAAAELTVVSSDGALVGPAARRRGRWLALGVPGILLGIALIVIGTAVLTDAGNYARVSITVAGVLATLFGIDRTAKAFFGAKFDTALWLSIFWLGLIVLSAIFADLLPLAEHENISKTLTETPLLRPDLFSDHPLGTDGQGLDVLGGVIYGARVSLVVGIGAVLGGMALGATLGLIAGYFRGRVDAFVGLFADAMLAFPPLILLLAMVAVLDPSMRNVTIALAVLTVPTYIRLTRANTMVFAQREFVLAAKAMGARNRRIVLRELMPNVAPPVISYAFIIIGALIVAEASLSFLGLGVQRPTPTWGNMIASGQSKFDRDPHVVFIPGICLFLTVYGLNKVGEHARKILDPRQRAL